MNQRATSPATKTFRVFADRTTRCFQEVEAMSPQEAFDTAATQPECWENCFEVEDPDEYRLSHDVLDAATEEYSPVGDVPRCKTCGSEIVETVNDSHFGDGECGGCEYRRYTSQPGLRIASQALYDRLQDYLDVSDEELGRLGHDGLVAAMDDLEAAWHKADDIVPRQSDGDAA